MFVLFLVFFSPGHTLTSHFSDRAVYERKKPSLSDALLIDALTAKSERAEMRSVVDTSSSSFLHVSLGHSPQCAQLWACIREEQFS